MDWESHTGGAEESLIIIIIISTKGWVGGGADKQTKQIISIIMKGAQVLRPKVGKRGFLFFSSSHGLALGMGIEIGIGNERELYGNGRRLRVEGVLTVLMGV